MVNDFIYFKLYGWTLEKFAMNGGESFNNTDTYSLIIRFDER